MPAASASNKGVFVLCYHALKEKKDPYSLSPATFKDEIARLKQNGFTFVSFDDVKNDRITGTKNILVTIDDGNESVYNAYYTIMKPNGIKPVLGIYPAIIGKMNYAMTWDQLKKLRDEGCYIAAHGYNHMYLSSKYYVKDLVQFKKEIHLSKKVLEQKLGITIDTMIYPFGVFSPEAITEMKTAGYKYGFSLVQHLADVPLNDPFNIPRYMLTKPNQKGLIAYFIKSGAGEGTVASVTAEDKTKAGNNVQARERERVTVKNYTHKLKQLVINDIIFMPDAKNTQVKKHKTSKTTLKSSVKSSKGSDVKNKKVKYFPARENKKMTDRETKPEGKKHSFLQEVKDFYFTLLERSSRLFISFREIAWHKLEQIKQKTSTLFS